MLGAHRSTSIQNDIVQNRVPSVIQSRPSPLIVVGLAGLEPGLSCLHDLLSRVAAEASIAFLVALPPDLDKDALSVALKDLPAQELEEQETQLLAGQVYLVPVGSALTLAKDGLASLKKVDDAPVDDMVLKTIADTFGGDAVGILLSGRHGAGAFGLRAICGAGGLTMMEPLTERKQQSLLHEVDHILGPIEIASELTVYAQRRAERATDIQEDLIASLDEICRLVQEVTGHDLRLYKKATLLRRINRLIQVKHMDSAAAYLDFLRSDDQAVRRLLDEVLIQVTSFFRDSQAFEFVGEEILKPLITHKNNDREIRIWVPGCCTGEEVYSLAILCCEAQDSKQRVRNIRLFGTDVSPRALATARRGEYPLGIERQVSDERLERFFDKQSDRYVVNTRIREMCLFATQNLVGDPPFSDIDLVSCRNVMIYLGTSLQRKLMSVFHYALKPGGFLFLGPSESLPDSDKLFLDVNTKFRVSQRKNAEARPWISFEPAQPARRSIEDNSSDQGVAPAGRQSLHAVSQRILLDDFSPPYAVVREDGSIAYLFGEVREFLNPSVDSVIDQMARTGLRKALRETLADSRRTKRRAVGEHGSVETPEGDQAVRLVVVPLPSFDDGDSSMVIFQKVGQAIKSILADDEGDEQRSRDDISHRLQQELSETRSELDEATQAHRATQEELKSYNEELRSMNEELQSSNEELRLSQEETQAAHRQARTASTDLENLLDSTEIATVFVDRTQRVQGYTPAATEILNLIPSDIGRPYGHLTHTLKDMPPLPLVDSEKSEVALSGLSGKSYLRRVLPYRQLDKSVQGSVITFIDVTALKSAEDQLRASQERGVLETAQYSTKEASLTQARDVALSETALKTRFHASVSHELRTPLAGLSGMIEMLLSTRLTANQKDFVQTIQHCSDSLRHLIDDMLDMARIEIDKLVLYPRACQVEGFLHRVVEPFRYLSSKGGVEVRCSAGDVPAYLVFDPARLQQILNNLIGNSLKFTQDGSVTLELSCLARTDQSATMRFGVRDTGSGISEAECKQIFLPFVQGEEGSDRKHGGIGLGLSISRQLVTLMGGSIEVSSELGRGSCFWFDLELPVSTAEAVEMPAPILSDAPSSVRKGRILLAEDNLINQRVIVMQLEKLGHRVVVVDDGLQALENLSEDQQVFDLVVLDCEMPQLDGYETTRRIRSSRSAYSGIPVLALTAHAMGGAQAACDLAGMDAFLRKPASMDVLGATIERLLSKPKRRTAAQEEILAKS